jgi:hypothetical protein
MLGKTRSQFGLPKCVGARSKVIASLSAPTSCTMMLVMSSSLIFAVRYMLISIRFCTSCSSIACKSEWNHSADPKSRITQVKYTWMGVGENAMGEKRELTLERRVGLELLKLFIRYQIDLRILVARRQTTSNLEKNTHEAKGVTPIPAPTRSTVSYFKKSSDAEPKGPSTMMRGRMRFTDGLTSVPTTLPPAASFSLFSPFPPLFLSKSQPSDLANSRVKSPTTRMCIET